MHGFNGCHGRSWNVENVILRYLAAILTESKLPVFLFESFLMSHVM